ncbi:hypothetical protein E1200_21860 [Actinomadura sp. GC306]|uniref:hypothetical protein n=1 Tax=Actinomadura sp. GC306 TaxID=2530367 RepID=UPI0010534DBE|nr:hypothetical protein [Actinomadura sp. GC306]TDC63611.1 hypothetical protein E1200_21860 [Actinomadura sp. GC306]
MPESEPWGPWSASSEGRDAYAEERDPYAEESGPYATGRRSRDSGGVDVKLGPRARERERARRERAARRARGRALLVTLGVLVLAGLVTIGVVLTSGSDGNGTQAGGGSGAKPVDVEPPPAGKPLEVSTADGYRYRVAAVSNGLNEDAVTEAQTELPSGTSFPYIDYLLTNAGEEEALLDYPGDPFVKRELVAEDARERCEPQGGAPDDMCIAPAKSEVVRRLVGGELVDGDGGDKYMPPGSTYLVRVTVQVPVDRDLTSSDIGLYVAEQLFVGTDPAKHVPFP